MRGYAAGNESDDSKRDGCENDRDRIVRCESVELALDEAAGEERRGRADEHSGQDESQHLAQNEPQHVASIGAESHPDADFDGALRGHVVITP